MQDNKYTKLCKISSHKHQNYHKHTWVFRKIFNFYSKWETPPYKVFDYSVKIYLARYHTPLKTSWIIHQPITEKEKHTSPCLFSHNKGMTTMICVLQPLFPPPLNSTRPQVYSKVRLPHWTCLIWTRYLTYTAHACICTWSKWAPRLRLTHVLHCLVRSCLRVTRYKIDLQKLLVFNKVCRGHRNVSSGFMETLP